MVQRFLLLAFLTLFAHAGPDLLVYGGTPQGVAAAVAAAREGLRVVLISPTARVGGVLTGGWLATWDLSWDEKKRFLQEGLFLEMYRRFGGDASFDVRRAEGALRRMLEEAGVEVVLEAPLEEVVVQGGYVVRMRFGGREGRVEVPILVVDATDTAELAALAGARFTLGREDTGLDKGQMAATLIFRLEGLPWGAVFLALNHEGIVRKTGAGARGRSAWGFGELGEGYLPSSPRFRLRGLNLARQDDGSVLVNALLIHEVDGTNPIALRQAYAEAVAEAGRVVEYLREKSPLLFGSARLTAVAPELYVRESRHLLGLYRLKADDVLFGRTFPDALALGGYPLDGQAYLPRETPYLLGTPAPYGIPFRTLLPQGFRNLLVVSQAASFDSVAAFSARVVPTQVALGQGAGVAAAVARERGVDFPSLLVPEAMAEVRARLGKQGSRLLGGEASSKEAQDRKDPGFFQAVDLLRRGLFAGPYNLRGELGLARPIRVGEFLANLDHFYRTRADKEAQAVVLTARELYRGELYRPLEVQEARRILTALGRGFEGLDRPRGTQLTRGEAARVLYPLFGLSSARASRPPLR